MMTSQTGHSNIPKRAGEISEEEITHYLATRHYLNTDHEDDSSTNWGAIVFSNDMTLEVKIRDFGGRFTFACAELSELLIGRHDDESGISPQIDLSKFGGLNMGVSRRHAMIIRRDRWLEIVDLGSPNGTFVNGRKLTPNLPRKIRDGDDIRLGHLVLRVGFRQKTVSARL